MGNGSRGRRGLRYAVRRAVQAEGGSRRALAGSVRSLCSRVRRHCRRAVGPCRQSRDCRSEARRPASACARPNNEGTFNQSPTTLNSRHARQGSPPNMQLAHESGSRLRAASRSCRVGQANLPVSAASANSRAAADLDGRVSINHRVSVQSRQRRPALAPPGPPRVQGAQRVSLSLSSK